MMTEELQIRTKCVFGKTQIGMGSYGPRVLSMVRNLSLCFLDVCVYVNAKNDNGSDSSIDSNADDTLMVAFGISQE